MVIKLTNISWVTILFGSIPEAFFTFLIGLTLIGYKVELKKLGIMACVEGVLVYFVFNYVSMPFGIHTVAVMCILVAILVFFVKINIKHAVIAVSLGFAISFFSQYINWIIISSVGVNIANMMQNETRRMILFSPSIIFLIIIGWIVCKKNILLYDLTINLKESLNKFKKNNLVVMIIFSMIVVLMMLFNYYTYISRNESWNLEKKLIIVTFSVYFILLMIIIIILSKLNEKNIKQEYENILVERHLNDMKNNISILRKQRHDYLRHIQIIYSLLGMNNYTEAKEYIDNLTECIKQEGNLVETGNIFLNAIIKLKQEQAINKKVSFYTTVKDNIEDLKIPPFEICSIVSNIIDNAFDALDECIKNDKCVEIAFSGDNLCYVFKIKNNGNKIEDIDRVFEEGFTTKKDNNRGYGLYIVRQILKKYKSSIFVESNEDVTEFTIIIPKY